jgi:hypothetical protein
MHKLVHKQRHPSPVAWAKRTKPVAQVNRTPESDCVGPAKKPFQGYNITALDFYPAHSADARHLSIDPISEAVRNAGLMARHNLPRTG